MSQYIPVNLAYASYDPAGGADETLYPIIFLHGLTGSKEMWMDVPQSIADKTKRKVYSIDARNHGETEWSDEFDFDMNADDILHFMDTISAPKAILVGHSMGGITSIKAALKSPEQIEMVFIEDMYVKKLNQDVLNMIAAFVNHFKSAVLQLPADCAEDDVVSEILKYIKGIVPELVENLINGDIFKRIKFPMKRDANGRYQIMSNVDVILKALKNADTLMSEAKGLYEGPSYFIYGTVSPFKVNEDEDNIRKFFPESELIPVENADHSIHIQFPEKFIDIVVEKILNH